MHDHCMELCRYSKFQNRGGGVNCISIKRLEKYPDFIYYIIQRLASISQSKSSITSEYDS